MTSRSLNTLDNIDWSKRESAYSLNIAWKIVLSRCTPSHLPLAIMLIILQTTGSAAVQACLDANRRTLDATDDKMILTEVHLLESRVFCGIGNLAKAKVSVWGSALLFLFLTLSKSIGCLDFCEDGCQLNILSSSSSSSFGPPVWCTPCRDKDYTTAYSYFYETFENMSSQDDPSALNALKYMLLCKVMLNMVRHQSS